MVAGPTAIAGTLTGNCWIEKVKGRPGSYLELYEWNIFAVRAGVNGQSFRVGLPPNPRAYYGFDLSSGLYSLYLDQPLFWGRPKVVPAVNVAAGGTVTQNVELPTDYSCAFGDKSGAWGTDPWTSWSDVWYQSFVATGSSITGVVFKLAGSNTSQIIITVHRDNGGVITTWPQVGTARTVYGVGSLNDNWVRYRSGDIPTTPGQRYGLKLTGTGGNPNNNYAIFRRFEDGAGYASGQAYNAAGQPQDFDLYAIILSDNDGTLIPYCSLAVDPGDLAGWAGVWAQQIKAKGNALAGATLYFAGGDTWEKDITFKVRTGGAAGPQVGPSKTGHSAYQASTNAHVAVSWGPGEVPLTPGQIYYIEASHPTGFNPLRFTNAINDYADGTAYQSFGARPNVDLHMQVVEYANVQPPTINRSPASLTRTVVRGRALPPDSFTLNNSGGGVLNYQITDCPPWLIVQTKSGSATVETDTIAIEYHVESLPIGMHTCTITITDPNATNNPQTVPVNLTVTAPPYAPPDFDKDGDVDQDDFGHLQACYSGPGVIQTSASCQDSLLDGDEDVDLEDLALFKRCFLGAGVQVVTTCMD